MKDRIIPDPRFDPPLFLDTGHTCGEVAEYITGFASGPHGGPYVNTLGSIYNALLMMDDYQDGIEAWLERRAERDEREKIEKKSKKINENEN